MAQIVTITNPLTGQPAQVDQLDHTAQQIDDAIARALPGGAIDITLQKKVNPNLLDNWYFANPVNQRGNTEYTGSGYTIDRFIQKVDSGVVQVTSNGIVLSGSDCLLHQIIEFSQDLIGETVTFSVLTANNHLYACTGTVTDSANTNFAVKFLDSSNSNIAVISDSSKRVIVQIRAMGGATYTVKAVKLELGSQQTLAHQENGNWVLNEIPDYGEQLARCQRYFQLYSDADKRPAKAVDCRPVMRTDPSQGTIVIGSTTYYYNIAAL